MWVQYAVWWAEVVGWWLPLIAAASLGWMLLKNVKAVLVLGLVAAVLTYLVWGLPGSSTVAFAPAPQQPVAVVPVQPMSDADALALRRSLYAHPPVPNPAPQVAHASQQRCYFYVPMPGVAPPANFPSDLDPTKRAHWCEPAPQP